MKYVDFSLELRQAEGARCRLMVRSPQGETESYFAIPDGVQSVLGRSGRGAVNRRSAGTTLPLISVPDGSVVPFRYLDDHGAPSPDALEIGSRLHECLFRGRVAELFAETCAMAKVGGKGVRVLISALDASLSNIPWELLRSSKREYLCLSEHTPVIRSALVDKPVEPLRAELPLRILGILSGVGPPLPHLGEERRQIDYELTTLRESGLVDIEWLESPTALSLFEALDRKNWHVVHFAGHGAFDHERRQGQIMVASATGHVHPMSARDLRAFLKDRPSIRLVFVNACNGAVGDPQELVSSTAATLMDAGIPAVVAMQSPVSDRLAAVFAQLMYRRLASGASIEVAITHARKGVYLESSTEWATPVLYSRAADGVLFSFLPRDPPAPGGVPVPTLPSPGVGQDSVQKPGLAALASTAPKALARDGDPGGAPRDSRWRWFVKGTGASLLAAVRALGRGCAHAFATGSLSLARPLLALAPAGVLLGTLVFYRLHAQRWWPWRAAPTAQSGNEAPSPPPPAHSVHPVAASPPPAHSIHPVAASPPTDETPDLLAEPCRTSAEPRRWVIDARSALCEAERGHAAAALNHLVSLEMAHDVLPSSARSEITSRIRVIQERAQLGAFRIFGYEAGSSWTMYLNKQPIEAGTELLFAEPGKHRIIFKNASATTSHVYQMKDRGSVSVIVPRSVPKAQQPRDKPPKVDPVRPNAPPPTPASEQGSKVVQTTPASTGNPWLREVLLEQVSKGTVYLRQLQGRARRGTIYPACLGSRTGHPRTPSVAGGRGRRLLVRLAHRLELFGRQALVLHQQRQAMGREPVAFGQRARAFSGLEGERPGLSVSRAEVVRDLVYRALKPRAK